MTEQDVDDLARVLAGQARGAAINANGWRRIAAAVLASGVVVSAQDVRALAKQWEADETRHMNLGTFGPDSGVYKAIMCREHAHALRSLCEPEDGAHILPGDGQPADCGCKKLNCCAVHQVHVTPHVGCVLR